VNSKNEYHHRDILKIFSDIKPRSLIHWAEIGLIRPLSEPENRGGKRAYSYRNLIEIAFIRQLLKYNVSLKEVKRIVGHEKFRDAVSGANYDLVYVHTVRSGREFPFRNGRYQEPFFTTNVPMIEGFILQEDFELNVRGQTSGIFVNLADLKKFIDFALE
jgi:DNA-binding transcriptional MerR regulator